MVRFQIPTVSALKEIHLYEELFLLFQAAFEGTKKTVMCNFILTTGNLNLLDSNGNLNLVDSTGNLNLVGSTGNLNLVDSTGNLKLEVNRLHW